MLYLHPSLHSAGDSQFRQQSTTQKLFLKTQNNNITIVSYGKSFQTVTVNVSAAFRERFGRVSLLQPAEVAPFTYSADGL